MMARKPFASLLALAGIASLLVCALALAAVPCPYPIRHLVDRCTHASDSCLALVRAGRAFGAPVLLALLPWSMAHGLGAGWKQWRLTRATLARLQSRGVAAPSGALRAICAAAGLAGKVEIIDSRAPLALCRGLWRTRVWLSTGTLSLLTPSELLAVLRHERAHLVRRHPLQLLIARSAAAAFPFLPAIRELAAALPRTQELAADRAVIHAGERHALGRALLRMVDSLGDAPVAPLALGMTGALNARLDQLAGDAPPPTMVSRQALVRTCVVLASGLGLLVMGTLAAGTPLAVLPFRLAPTWPDLAAWREVAIPTLLCLALLEGQAGLRRMAGRSGRQARPRR
ncbi:MAG TPA: M56 family metallopeptidase [Chloroflexota bacterium]|jgi:Zn-dependent protease with chaperone function